MFNSHSFERGLPMSLHRTARYVALVLAFLALTSVLVPASAAATATATVTAVTTGNVMLRTGPGTNYASLNKVAKGATVTVLDNTATSGWWKVNASGQEGYITAQYLKITGTTTTTASSTAVTKEVVTIRKTVLRTGPSRSFDLVTNIAPGEHVSILDASFSKTWVPAAYNGLTGYIDMAHVKEDSLLSAESAPATAKPAATPVPTAAPADNTASNAQTATGDTAGEATKTDINVGAGSLAQKIAGAKKINSDTVGWIKVPGTNVDEPILYRANWYYASHNIYKKKSYEGVYPFANSLSKNVVIFGHNLRGSGQVFHQLHHLQEGALGYSKCQSGACKRAISSSQQDWYKTGAGRTWDISIFGKQRWEVFAMYEVKAKEPIATLRNNWNLGANINGSVKSWIDYQLNRSEIKFGVPVSEKDQFMTLITCGTNYDSASANSRLFVFLKNVD